MKHAVGSFVMVPFVGNSKQVGQITRIARTGSVKIRAFNATRGWWMPNERTFTVAEVDAMSAAKNVESTLPAPPAVK